MPSLADFVRDIADGRIRVIDLTQTLAPDFPTVVLPPAIRTMRPVPNGGDIAL